MGLGPAELLILLVLGGIIAGVVRVVSRRKTSNNSQTPLPPGRRRQADAPERPAPRHTRHDVFVSYSSRDKQTADAICANLERNGIRCWIAPRDVLPGMDQGAAIVSALNECRVFVLVFSAHANSSDHVLRELERAASKGKPILPFRLDSAAYSESMEYFLSKLHWLDALTPPLQSHIDRLVGTLNGMLKPSGLKM